MTWAELLDEMEARLHASRGALAGNAAPPAPLSPPDDLGPLPDELRPRAVLVLSATRALEAEVTAHQYLVAEHLQALQQVLAHTSVEERPPSVYVNVKA